MSVGLGLQRLTSDTLTSASGATLASEAYGYDSNGNVTSQATGGLLAASSQTYGYDEALTSAAGSAGTTGYSYALNGSLSAVTPPSGSAQGYTWDAYGNMASAGGVSYGYDALGRMVARTGSAGTTPVSYLGTGTLLASDGTSLYSYDPSGAMTGEGPAAGGAGYAVMTDQHGDVAAAFAPTSSASSLEGSSSYSPYGTVTGSGGSMPGAGYQGDYTDPATGLVYMNARWYDPATGGFVSSDTAGGTPVPSGVDGNPYAYAGGNPLTGTDPTGQFHAAGARLPCATPTPACTTWGPDWATRHAILRRKRSWLGKPMDPGGSESWMRLTPGSTSPSWRALRSTRSTSTAPDRVAAAFPVTPGAARPPRAAWAAWLASTAWTCTASRGAWAGIGRPGSLRHRGRPGPGLGPGGLVRGHGVRGPPSARARSRAPLRRRPRRRRTATRAPTPPARWPRPPGRCCTPR